MQPTERGGMEIKMKEINLSELIAETSVEQTKIAWEAAERGIVDYLAAAAAGAKTETARKLIDLIEREGGAKRAPLLFTEFQGIVNGKANEGQSALYNGVIGHVLDYDDVHEEVRGHPSTVILPALIALSSEDRNEERFLAAYIIGVDVMARLGRCIPEHYVAGWHSTATFGAIAAAAAGAYYREMNVEEIEKALGIAATRAAGLRLQFGSDMKAFHAGYAAKIGVEAVQYLQAGLTANLGVLTGKQGFLALYGEGNISSEELTKDWGLPWRISSPGLWMKRYPFCSAVMHAADAAMQIKEEYNILPQNIKKIELVFPPNGDAALIHPQPRNGEEGRFSPEYVVALILSGKELNFSRFSYNQKIDTTLCSLMKKMLRLYDDTIIASEEAMPKGRFTILRVEMLSGERYSARVDVPNGSPAKPLTAQQLQAKLAEHAGAEMNW